MQSKVVKRNYNPKKNGSMLFYRYNKLIVFVGTSLKLALVFVDFMPALGVCNEAFGISIFGYFHFSQTNLSIFFYLWFSFKTI
jgi:hypothetical protein